MLKTKGNFSKMLLPKFISFATELHSKLIETAFYYDLEKARIKINNLYKKHNIKINKVYDVDEFRKEFPKFDDDDIQVEEPEEILNTLFKNYAVVDFNSIDAQEEFPLYYENFWIYDFDRDALLEVKMENYSDDYKHGDYLLLAVYELIYKGKIE
ncbi:Hypothetical protein MPV1_12 [Marinitoga phage MPV1]|uniref:Uncharacterized protein n=1 Tax=Marinitoga piezophila (strain DSM 14283 / JCM 11233 / KA3) TaxID=443254 RepID=H2J434_MARPK|nr:hypothetical protein [Marinitoga piezophila]AEX84762.1 hypothetical protein Marpi_0311 [Marinitoga piezophila KA3]